MKKEEILNELIKGSDTNKISDGYHTFGQLYDHRITIYMVVCKLLKQDSWRSLKHSDGSEHKGWFVLGLFKEKGKQITYHLPISDWDGCDFAETLEIAPEWDQHSSDDVIERLRNLLKSL